MTYPRESRPAGNGAANVSVDDLDGVDSTCAACGTLDLSALATCVRFGIVCSSSTCAAELMAVVR